MCVSVCVRVCLCVRVTTFSTDQRAPPTFVQCQKKNRRAPMKQLAQRPAAATTTATIGAAALSQLATNDLSALSTARNWPKQNTRVRNLKGCARISRIRSVQQQ